MTCRPGICGGPGCTCPDIPPREPNTRPCRDCAAYVRDLDEDTADGFGGGVCPRQPAGLAGDDAQNCFEERT